MRVVLDTNTIVSALVFGSGQLSWLRHLWKGDEFVVLASDATIEELIRVLAYPKFELTEQEIQYLLEDYLPYITPVAVKRFQSNPKCDDPDDQIFVDLAISAKAEFLVTGDKALLGMHLPCAMVTAANFRDIVSNR